MHRNTVNANNFILADQLHKANSLRFSWQSKLIDKV